jgi:hypothetical protein
LGQQSERGELVSGIRSIINHWAWGSREQIVVCWRRALRDSLEVGGEVCAGGDAELAEGVAEMGFHDSFPLTSTGKIRKDVLSARFTGPAEAGGGHGVR